MKMFKRKFAALLMFAISIINAFLSILVMKAKVFL